MADYKGREDELVPERWLPVPGFDNYQVSDWGRVIRTRRTGRQVFLGRPRPDGYTRASLSKGGRTHQKYVAHLVLTAFRRPRHDSERAKHLDGNRGNDALTNLEWRSVRDLLVQAHRPRRRRGPFPTAQVRDADAIEMAPGWRLEVWEDEHETDPARGWVHIRVTRLANTGSWYPTRAGVRLRSRVARELAEVLQDRVGRE